MFNLIVKIAQTSGAQVYAALLGIITLSITARWLGPEGRGIIATISTWAIVFVEIASLSLAPVLIYRATQKCDDKWLGRMMGTLGVYIIGVTLIIWLIVGLFYFGERYWAFPQVIGNLPPIALIMGFLLLPLGLAEHYTKALLNIEDRLHIYNWLQVIGSTSNLFWLVVLVIGLGMHIYGVLIARLMWDTIIAIGSIRALYPKAKKSLTSCTKELKSLLHDGSKMYLNTIGALLILHVDILMINAYLGAEATGLYQLAVHMGQIMLMLPYAATTVLQGEITRRGLYGVWSYQKKILILTLLAMIAASLILGLTAKWWMIWLTSEKFEPSIILFQYLLISVLFASTSAIINVQWIARGLFWQISAISMIKGIGNIALNAILLPKYGLMGAVYSTLSIFAFSFITDIGMFIYCEIDTRRHNNSSITDNT
ncbi:MAG TPA: hypothetical protein ENJ33_06960 [Thiothrix sp.]|nr:hypothetical protein [Thiothrix sp.]